MLFAALKRKCEMLGVPALPDALVASVPAQRLWHFRDEKLLAEYKISTSRAAPSCVRDSLGTPDGLFSVVEKVGAGAPAGTVFKARVSTGMHFSVFLKNAPDENLITSRILRIQGEEDGYNRGGDRDTYSRFVYLHGTNQEHKLGTPNSHGCLLLGNADIIELFATLPDTPPGTACARLFITLKPASPSPRNEDQRRQTKKF